MEKIISHIKELLVENRMSQAECAKLAGLEQKKLNRMLNGKAKFLDTEAVDKVLGVFGERYDQVETESDLPGGKNKFTQFADEIIKTSVKVDQLEYDAQKKAHSLTAGAKMRMGAILGAVEASGADDQEEITTQLWNTFTEIMSKKKVKQQGS